MANTDIQKISREYIVDGKTSTGLPNKTTEKLYASHTSYIETDILDKDTGKSLRLAKVLENTKEDIIAASNAAKAMSVELTGEVTGRATCSDDWKIVLKTSPSKKYAQTVILQGAVTGKASADSFDKGVVTVDTTYDRSIPQTVELTGEVTGRATVDSDGVITLGTSCNTATKVPLFINSCQWSLDSDSAANLAKTFGGTWECIGAVDIGITDTETDKTIMVYLYNKVSL